MVGGETCWFLHRAIFDKNAVEHTCRAFKEKTCIDKNLVCNLSFGCLPNKCKV